ncbi:hypothetical protein [Methylorubrum extorquens]|uniref:Uncharacterized protein n=1 Tax=Methylorubrum extorquens (strain ATCC 14718 / DSM 1338 / JCM 2805 / NCIMB 9133 / AM1) TaxID=272630 RepID=C5APW1_METEA|nr:hypothetical protein [Methylorubrum extorquens]ACS39996.1 hypothetical protein; putative exported protein [Methylorubrum extorquens AM1]MCP1541859.1 uncharacterized protein YraI [Methylorubrum extorquens]MCP1585604.1 uncharacterized protein YraI [Methylorubrum extorquens]
MSIAKTNTRAATALAVLGLVLAPAFAQAQGSATAGSAGSAASGGTSASTVGTGGTGSSLATGGAAAGGKTMDRSHVNETGNGGLNGQSKSMAHDGGTFSKSQTKTKVRDGESVESRTKTMSHEPGSKPVKSTTTTGATTGQ